MPRYQLTTLIRQTAREAGFAFGTGFPYRIARTSLTFPAMWMEPPLLTAREGREEGRCTYRVTLYLMVADKKYDETRKEFCWHELEAAAQRLLKRLGAEWPVWHLDRIRYTPAEFDLSNRGELSLKVEFDAVMAFSTVS